MMLVSSIIIALSTLLILTEAFWFYSRYAEEIDNNLEVAEVIGLSFDGFINDVLREEYAIGVAHQRLIPYSKENFQLYMKVLSDAYYSVRDFFITDSKGVIISSSRSESIKLDISDRQYFKTLLKGDTIVVSDFLRTKDENIAGFVVGRGFFNSSDDLDYAVFATVQASLLGEVTLKLKQRKGEYFTLFDKQGTLIYTDQPFDTLSDSERSWAKSDPLLQQALKGKDAAGFITVPIDKDKTRIGARVFIDNLGWVAGSAVVISIFLEPLIISFIALIISFFIATVTLLLSKKTVDSISSAFITVQQHVRKVALGDFTTIETQSNLIEFNDLINDTNSMAQQIKAREEKLQLLAAVVEKSRDFIALASPEMIPFYINKSGRYMVGLEDAFDISQTTFTDYMMPEDRSILQTFTISNKDERLFKEISLRNFKTGKPIPTIWNAFTIRDESGQLLGWATINPDLTALKQTTEALRNSEERFRSAIENLLDAFLILAPVKDEFGSLTDLTVEYVNRVALELAGQSYENVIKKKESILFPEWHRKMFSVYSSVLSTGRPAIIDSFLISFPGGKNEYSYFDVRASNIEGKIALACREVTSRVNSERALRESEFRFRQLANSMPQLVWTATPNGSVDYYNERYQDFGGISAGFDNLWQWEPVIHEDDLKKTDDAWQHSLKTGDIYQIEHRLKHADGSYHWYLSRGVPAKDDNGNIIKWYGTATNIDFSKQAQIELADSKAHLKELNEKLESIVTQRTEQVRTLSKALILAEQRERKRFSHILHEDLQQVLFSAKMQIDLIRLQIQSKPVFEDILDGVTEGIRLLNKALHITKNMALELNPPILYTQGLDAALSWLVSYMHTNQNLSIDLKTENISSIRDETQIMVVQMVRELLINVARHSGVSNASVEALCQNGFLKITVSDKGKGFDIQKMRERTVTISKLGLFSIEERLRLFGGELNIISAPGKGTECKIIIRSEQCNNQ